MRRVAVLHARQRAALLWLCLFVAQEAHGTPAGPTAGLETGKGVHEGSPGDAAVNADAAAPAAMIGTRQLLQAKPHCTATGNVESGDTCVVSGHDW
jgi:hypothetical protein